MKILWWEGILSPGLFGLFRPHAHIARTHDGSALVHHSPFVIGASPLHVQKQAHCQRVARVFSTAFAYSGGFSLFRLMLF